MWLFLLLLFPILTLSLPLIPQIEHRSLDEIYHAALKESRTLKVAWGGDIHTSSSHLITSFHALFPGIHLNVTSDLSKNLDTSSSDFADVAVLQSIHDFSKWKDQGLLLNYKVSQWDDIYPQFVDPDGAFTGLYILSLGSLIYTSPFLSLSPPSTLSLPSLLSLKNRPYSMALTYPNDDDAVLYLFSSLVNTYSWDIIHTLVNQHNVSWVRGTATAAMLMTNNYSSHSHSSYLHSSPQPIVSFATEPAFVNPSSPIHIYDSSSPSSPISYSSPYITWPQTGCIFASTLNPESSKLFLSFLLSDAHQLSMNSSGFATRKSFDTKGVFNQLPLMDATGYQSFMMDRENVQQWRDQFDDILGPPRGPNPNHINF